jgi:hypothetical protein
VAARVRAPSWPQSQGGAAWARRRGCELRRGRSLRGGRRGRDGLGLVGEDVFGFKGLPARFEKTSDSLVVDFLLELLEDGLVLGLHHPPHRFLGCAGLVLTAFAAEDASLIEQVRENMGISWARVLGLDVEDLPSVLDVVVVAKQGTAGRLRHVRGQYSACGVYAKLPLRAAPHGQHHCNKDSR